MYSYVYTILYNIVHIYAHMHVRVHVLCPLRVGFDHLNSPVKFGQAKLMRRF